MQFHGLKFIAKIIFYFFVLISLLFFGCSGRNSGRTELTFWAMGAEGENISKLLPRFKAVHPEIKVHIQKIPWALAHEKLLTAFAGQSTPDICQLGNTWIAEFQAMDALLSLDSLAARSSIVDQSNYFKGIWNTNLIGRRLFGIPWYVDTRLLFYRRDILAEAGFTSPPKTWDRWIEAARKIKKLANSKRRYSVFFSLIYNDWQVPVILIMENNGHLLKDNNSFAAFDDSSTVAALKYYLQFFNENLAPRNMTEVTNIYQGFSDGFFSMFITGPWNVNEIRKRYPRLNKRWGTAPMPAGKNGDSIAGGSSLVVFRNSRHSKEAWEFIEFLSTPEIQSEFFRLTGDLP
ncbi:MAG TPA: extracellular solute-binding protein, partial [Bacteroidetes bacterium]|nr:extracellular solute-binding protein [Bacteroidota bacterium]